MYSHVLKNHRQDEEQLGRHNATCKLAATHTPSKPGPLKAGFITKASHHENMSWCCLVSCCVALCCVVLCGCARVRVDTPIPV